MQSPQHWLGPLSAALELKLAGQRIEALRGGPMWLSLRVGPRFVCLFAQGSLRLAWLDGQPLPETWQTLLDVHEPSPFAEHLRGTTIQAVRLLRSPGGEADGLCIDVETMSLQIRWHPRPGAIWLAHGQELLAQQGRMDGDTLQGEAGSPDPVFRLSRHRERCRATLAEALTAAARQRLRQELERGSKRRLRLRLKLIGELTQAQAHLGLRAAADAVAARLHELTPGTSQLRLRDFNGVEHELEFDPRLTPAANLGRLYKRAAKAERAVKQLDARLAQLAEQEDAAEAVHTDSLDLDAVLAAAQRLAVDLGPAPRSEGEKREQVRRERLPYRSYRLPSGRELRVGRSATDNDELLRAHSHGRDLWFHAQGVEGSHVLLRHGAPDPTRAEIEAAARVAAHFSKARNSSLVPVLVTERRYVRKPRKAKAGTVVAERGETIFVPPGLPEDVLPAEES